MSSTCKATKKDGSPCTVKAKDNGYCRRHESQAEAGTNKATAPPPPADRGSGTSTTVGIAAGSIILNDNPPLWERPWNDYLKSACTEFLSQDGLSSPYRARGSGGELDASSMNLLVLKRRTTAGLGKLSPIKLPPDIRSDVQLLAFVTPFNEQDKGGLEILAKALRLPFTGNKPTKDDMLRKIVDYLMREYGRHNLKRVRISEDGEYFRQRLFRRVCLADDEEPRGLVHLLTPGRFAATVKEFLEWAKGDTMILTSESLPLMKSRQEWLVGLGKALKSMEKTDCGKIPEEMKSAMKNARETSMKSVLNRVQWEINGCSDCPALYDALVDHHMKGCTCE